MGAGVLLAWQHGGNLGHLARLLVLARAFRARGEHVTFAVADTAAAARVLDPARFAWIESPASLAGEDAGTVLNHADILLRCGFADTGGAATAVRAWQRLFARVAPSVIVVDAAPLALYAAHAEGRLAFALGHGFEIPPASGVRPLFAPWRQDAAAQGEANEASLRDALGRLADNLQQPAAPRCIAQLFDPHRVLLCTWPELDHLDRPEEERGYVGPLWPGSGEYPEHRFPDRTGRKVLAYLNLVDKRHDLLWQALQTQGANVTVLSPGGAARAREATRGWGVEVLGHVVDLAPLISQADVVINHGGMGLCSMTLLAGKPLLVLPENLEQAVLAYRLSRQGLAGATMRLRDRQKVRTKVERLLAAGGTSSTSAAAFAARYVGYQPVNSADALAARLLAPVPANLHASQ